MLSFDRETMLIAGVIVCIAVVAYMFNDMRKTKEDVHAVKTFSVNLMKNLTIEPVEDEAKPQTVTKIPVTEEKKEE